MNSVHFVIPVSPKTKKNHSQFIWTKAKNGQKYPRLIPSKQYTEFERASAPYCPPCMIDRPVNVQIVAYVERRNKVDLANMLNAVDDILVKYKTVTDDNRNIIYGHDGSRILYDKENPRVEITITEIEEGDFQKWETPKARKK